MGSFLLPGTGGADSPETFRARWIDANGGDMLATDFPTTYSPNAATVSSDSLVFAIDTLTSIAKLTRVTEKQVFLV